MKMSNCQKGNGGETSRQMRAARCIRILQHSELHLGEEARDDLIWTFGLPNMVKVYCRRLMTPHLKVNCLICSNLNVIRTLYYWTLFSPTLLCKDNHEPCWGKLLLKVMHCNIALLNLCKVMHYVILLLLFVTWTGLAYLFFMLLAKIRSL